MKSRKLLAACLLAVGLCFAPAVEARGEERGTIAGLLSELGPETDRKPWGEALAKMESKTPVRYTYLIIPVDQKDIAYIKIMLFNLLYSFLCTYQKAEIPAEFRFWMMEAGMRGENSDLFSSVPASLIPSLLLTVVCESGYRIEHVTSDHIILVRPIYEGELKELEDRLKGEG